MAYIKHDRNHNKKAKSVVKISSVLLVSLALLTGCTQQSKGLALSGTVEATEVDVNAEVSGKITKLLKDEGSSVEAGETIAEVESKTAALQVKSAEAGLKAAKAKLDELNAGSRTEEISQAEAAAEAAKANLDEVRAGNRSEQIAEAEATYKQAEESVSAAQKNYDYRLDYLKTMKELLQGEAVTEQDVKDAQNLTDTAHQQLISAKSQLQIAKEQVSLLQKGATQEAVRAAQANYKQALAKLKLVKNGATPQAVKEAQANVEQLQASLDEAKLQLNKYQIKALTKGILLYKNVELGQYVSPGSVIGTVQDNSQYWIKVYLPQKYNAEAKLNQKVTLTASALEGEKIEGTIIFKSPKAEFTPKNIETTAAKEENTVIALKVRIDSHTDKLSPGMTASVSLD